jgi:hypothetical protein
MIKRTSKGYQVKSEKGKNLSAPDLTKKEAEKRLAQVEMFKNMKKKGK